MEIYNITDLILYVTQDHITINELVLLVRKTIGKTYLAIGKKEKSWYIEKLKNYAYKYHDLESDAEKPFVINGEMPFNFGFLRD